MLYYWENDDLTPQKAMNVVRMIKMFGWESKIGEQMSVRRENELVWIKKRFFLSMANMVVK